MAEIIYDLVKIEQFLTRTAASGTEFLPVTIGGATYKMNVTTLITAVNQQKGYITGAALVPINTAIGTKVDKTAIVDNLNSSASTGVLSAKQGKILNDIIAGFAGQVGTGVIGEALPDTDPVSEGFAIYTASTVGVYENFTDVNGDPIEVTESDLTAGSGGLVQLWGNSDVWEKHVTVLSFSDYSLTTDVFN